MQKECLSDPKKLVPLLNRKLYEKGDCYSPGTGFCIKKDYKVYLAPAESNPDLLEEDDIFTFNEMLDENGNPDVDVAPTDSSLEPSKYSKLYLHLLEEFSCNCVLLVESQSAKMVADLYSDSLVFSNVECLTNIVSTVTKEKLRACDSLTIPIIPYKQPQEELISDLINALYSNTSTCCCIIKGFGMIFLGDCWKSVRSMLETVKQLLEYELNILQYRIRSDLSQQISSINRQIIEIREQISSDNSNNSMLITDNTQQIEGSTMELEQKYDLENKDTVTETPVVKESTQKDDQLMTFLNNDDENTIHDNLMFEDNDPVEEDTTNNELNVSEETNGKQNESEKESTKTNATDTQQKSVAENPPRRQTRKSTNTKQTTDTSTDKNAPKIVDKSTNDDNKSAEKPSETNGVKRATRASARVSSAKSPKAPTQAKAIVKKSSPNKASEDKASPNKASESKTTNSKASEDQSSSNSASEGKALEENSESSEKASKTISKSDPKAGDNSKASENAKETSSKKSTSAKASSKATANESAKGKDKPKSNTENKSDNSPTKEDQSELDLEIDLNPMEQDELFEGIDRSEFEETEPSKDDTKNDDNDDSCVIIDDDDLQATGSNQNKRSIPSKSPDKGGNKRTRFSKSPEAEKQKKRTVDDLAKLVILGATPSTAAIAARVKFNQYAEKNAAKNSQPQTSQTANLGLALPEKKPGNIQYKNLKQKVGINEIAALTVAERESFQSPWTKTMLGTAAQAITNENFEKKKLEAQANAAQAYAVEMARRAGPKSAPYLPVPASNSMFTNNSSSGVMTIGSSWNNRSSRSPGLLPAPATARQQLPAPVAARQQLPAPVASRQQLPPPVPGRSGNVGQGGRLQLPMPVHSQHAPRYDMNQGSSYPSCYSTNISSSYYGGSNNMPNMMAAYSGSNMPTNFYSQQNADMMNMSNEEQELLRKKQEIIREKMQLMKEMGMTEEEMRQRFDP